MNDTRDDIQKILIATDLKWPSDSAVQFGIALAGKLRAEVLLLHAVTTLPGFFHGSMTDAPVDIGLERLRLAAAKGIEEVRSQFSPELRVRSEILEAHPVEAILQVAKREAVDLIVMGTRGRSPFVSFLIGTVAQSILYHTKIPTITVPPTSGEPFRSGTVLCPVNFTEVASSALSYAVGLACRIGAEVLALYMVEAEEVSQPDEIERKIEEWIPADLREQCEIRHLVRRGNAAEELVKYARSHEADLIVIGARHSRFADTSVIGTTTERVIRHAPCPVLTVTKHDVPLSPAGTGKLSPAGSPTTPF
jgi:nucleotide-binding universal stress UspA family protein